LELALPGGVPPAVAGLTAREWVGRDVREVEVVAREVVVDVEVEVFEALVGAATLEVVVSDETPAD